MKLLALTLKRNVTHRHFSKTYPLYMYLSFVPAILADQSNLFFVDCLSAPLGSCAWNQGSFDRSVGKFHWSITACQPFVGLLNFGKSGPLDLGQKSELRTGDLMNCNSQRCSVQWGDSARSLGFHLADCQCSLGIPVDFRKWSANRRIIRCYKMTER